MIRALAPLLIATALLTACGKPADKGASAAVAPATEANLPADAASSAPAWSASNAGVGPLTADTAFDKAAIAALFPGSRIKAAFLNEDGAQTPILDVEGPEELALQIKQALIPGQVGRILATGGPVVGPKGETLLDRWSALGFRREDCVMGEGSFVNALICRRPDAANLAYVFGIPGYQASGDAVPADDLLTAKAFLREFLWQAPLSQ